MILWRFIGLSYVTYFTTISLLLGALYTLVDVLEMLVRYRDVPLANIVSYATIAFIPSFIFLFPISVLLAIALMLREWVLKDYFTSMAVCALSPQRVVVIIAVCSTLAATAIFLLQESVGCHITRNMAQAKVVLLNRRVPVHGWLRLGATSFITGLGSDAAYVLEGGGTPALSILFHVQLNKKTSTADRIKTIDFQSNTLVEGINVLLDASKIDVLTYSWQAQSCLKVFEVSHTRYGQRLIVDLLYFFLQIIVLPLLALMLFFLWQKISLIRWGSIPIAYLMLGLAHSSTQLLGSCAGFLLLIVILAGFLAYFFSIKV